MSKEKQGASNAGATHIPREAMFRREHWPHIDDYNNIHLIDKEKLGIELPDWYGLLMKHHSGGANAIPTQILKHSKLKQSKPNEKDLELIKSIVRSDSVNVDAFGVYESIASSDEVDSDRDKFALPILAEMAKQYKEGRPIVWGHDRQGGIGRSFDAYIESTEEKNYLIVKFYVLDTAVVPTGKAKDLLDAAVYNDVSVSLAIPEGYKFVESEESADGRYFREFSNPKGLSVFHLGIVDAGANQDARLKSTFPLDDTFTGKNQPEMPEKREIKIKSLDQTREVPTDLVEVIETLDKRVSSAEEALKVYRDKENAELEKQKEALTALYMRTKPAKKEDAEAFVNAIATNPSLLNKQILELKEAETEMIEKSQLNVSPEGAQDANTNKSSFNPLG